MAPIETLHVPRATNAAAVTETATPEVIIRQFEPRDLKEVEQLFADGMLYYADNFPELRSIWETYVQESIADDLAKIHDVYIARGGNFWVATVRDPLEGDREVVAAIVALEKKENGEGELRRMSVNAAYRRYGLGRKIVAHLEQWAKAHGYTQVWLSTGAVMTDACKFYPSIGYVHTKTEVYSEDPYFEAYYFAKEL